MKFLRLPWRAAALLICACSWSQTATNPMKADGGVKSPVVIHQVDPTYPSHGIFHKAKPSDVKLRLVVDEQGMPQDVRVVESGGDKFDQSALAAVRQYRFKPATREGNPVAVEIFMVVKFRVF